MLAVISNRHLIKRKGGSRKNVKPRIPPHPTSKQEILLLRRMGFPALKMMKKFIANTAAVMAAICMTVPAMPVMAATSEADFEGVWKCESLSAFGFDFDAADYGMDDSYLTIQDGKLSVFSSSGYTEDEEVKDLDLEFADGKYTLKLDEDSAKKVSGESDDLLAGCWNG